MNLSIEADRRKEKKKYFRDHLLSILGADHTNAFSVFRKRIRFDAISPVVITKMTKNDDD